MTTAFVLAGGASLGAVQAGMVQVLLEAGIEPDLIVGSSVGHSRELMDRGRASAGAWLATRQPVAAPVAGS